MSVEIDLGLPMVDIKIVQHDEGVGVLYHEL